MVLEKAKADVTHYSFDGIDAVVIDGHIDIFNVDTLTQMLSNYAGSSEKLVVDLRKTTYVDSAVLEQLALALNEQNANNKEFGVLVLEGSQPEQVLYVVMFHTLTTVTTNPSDVGLPE